MTPKRVLNIDFSEIANVEIRCNSCGTSITIPLPKIKPPIDFDCPGCNKRLWGNETEHTFVRLGKFMELLSDWKAEDDRRFVLGCSITEPS